MNGNLVCRCILLLSLQVRRPSPSARGEWFKVSLLGLWLARQVFQRGDKFRLCVPWRTAVRRSSESRGESVAVFSYLTRRGKRIHKRYGEIDSHLFYRGGLAPRSFGIIYFCFLLFFKLHHEIVEKMSASGLWINAMWILLFAIFDAAFSNYSEDQCSWRGRQVFIHVIVCRLCSSCMLHNEKRRFTK